MTVKANLTFSLPEDHDSDKIIISESLTQSSVNYVVIATLDYSYGQTKIEHDIDEQRWYKIQFFNTKNGRYGPLSEPVFGGTYSSASPFLAVSTTTDGANYATSQDLFEYSGLSTQDVSEDRVSQALRRARALIDWRTAEMGVDRFEVFESDVARRKYNASLRILKEAEINIALGNLYQNLCDDLIIQSRREGDGEIAGGIAIGGTAISGDTLAERAENIAFLATLSDRYFVTGENLLSSLDSNSIRLTSNDFQTRYPRFKHPGGQYFSRHYGNWPY